VKKRQLIGGISDPNLREALARDIGIDAPRGRNRRRSEQSPASFRIRTAAQKRGAAGYRRHANRAGTGNTAASFPRSSARFRVKTNQLDSVQTSLVCLIESEAAGLPRLLFNLLRDYVYREKVKQEARSRSVTTIEFDFRDEADRIHKKSLFERVGKPET
jgi:hypothetical protein